MHVRKCAATQLKRNRVACRGLSREVRSVWSILVAQNWQVPVHDDVACLFTAGTILRSLCRAEKRRCRTVLGFMLMMLAIPSTG